MDCPDCGARMIPLLTSMVCPNACEKKLWGPPCPSCGSSKTEPFDITGILDCFAIDDTVRDSVTYHCIPCGDVWNVEREKPETD